MRSQQLPTSAHSRASSLNPQDIEVASSQSSHSESDNDGGVAAGGVEEPIPRPRIYDPFPSSSRFSSNAGAADEAEVDPDQKLFQDIVTTTKATHVYGSLAQELALFEPFTPATGVGNKYKADPDRETFQGTPPMVVTTEETYAYGSLAEELALFASCLIPSPCPDPSKTPTQASVSEAELQRSQVQAVIDERKLEMKRDLLELIQETEGGPNWDLIESIDRMMRHWQSLHERLEAWRRDLKGEKVRAVHRRALGGRV
ncbi:hypothetical protein IFR05_007066 [Cadophora sp. M221]|nr:hypothetical protein IFR05_007066 [Cadophora sp. M221]